MDYSLLVGIEKLEKDGDLEPVHQIGANRKSFMLGDDENGEEVEMMDVGELMSLKHCYSNGRVVYHFATIDYL